MARQVEIKNIIFVISERTKIGQIKLGNIIVGKVSGYYGTLENKQYCVHMFLPGCLQTIICKDLEDVKEKVRKQIDIFITKISKPTK